MSNPNPPTPLDERTESVMELLIRAGMNHGYVEKLSIADCGSCQDVLNALRTRIRELVEEARKEGARPFILSTNLPSIFP